MQVLTSSVQGGSNDSPALSSPSEPICPIESGDGLFQLLELDGLAASVGRVLAISVLAGTHFFKL